MEEIEVKMTLTKQEFTSLAAQEAKAVEEAVRQLDFAYAPYSKFRVGAAVILEDGSIYGGCNQENASYPLCMCGERVAIYHATISKPGVKIKAVVITAKSPSQKLLSPVMPCGACRQVIKEYEDRYNSPIKIILKTDDEFVYSCESAAAILPIGFDSSFL
jgi:cytidine deaminase